MDIQISGHQHIQIPTNFSTSTYFESNINIFKFQQIHIFFYKWKVSSACNCE